MYLGDQFGDDGIKDITSILRRAVLEGDESAAGAFQEGYKVMILSLAGLD